ncbi:tail fibers protein [Vibrio phage VPG01]|nr:tail fibers protein [Vibrio phage VPG01]
MAYTLLKECTVVLVYKGVGYHFDALTQLDFSQTFNKTSGSRKTLHSRRAKPYTFANSKNSATFSLSILGTQSFAEGVLFELAGLTKIHNSVYSYEDNLNISPEICDIFLVTTEGVYKIKTAALESLSISLSLSEALTFETSFTASSIDKVPSIDLSAGMVEQGTPLKPTPIQYKLDNEIRNSIINAGISIQQTISWREDRSLHDAGSLYTPKHPVLTDRSFGINTNVYLNTIYPTPDKSHYSNLELYKSGLLCSMKDALVTHRVAPADVFTEAHDIRVTDQTNKIIVEYGGYLV